MHVLPVLERSDTALPTDLPARPGAARVALATAACVAAWAAMRAVFFSGFDAADDFHHVRWAWEQFGSIPDTHWETRWPYNLLLAGALRLFGYGQWQAALPGLLGSAMILLAVFAFCLRGWGSLRAAVLAGLLLAVLPRDVFDATRASAAKELGTGLFALAVLCTLWPSRRAALAAGALLALSATTHLALVFACGMLLVATFLAWPQRRRWVLWAGAAMAAGMVLGNLVVFWIWTGDPLHRFRVITAVHMASLETYTEARSPVTPAGAIDWGFFARPVKDLLFSKAFVFWGGLALAAGVAWRRHLRPQGRMVLATALLTWLWLGYGTHSPTKYEPLPGTTIYWQPLVIPIVLLCAFGLDRLRRRWLLAAATATLAAPCILVLGLSGSWGQSIQTSRQLLAYAAARPGPAYVTDERTLREMILLNGMRVPDSIYLPPCLQAGRWGGQPLPADAAGPVRVLLNPLNDPREPMSQVNDTRQPAVFAWLEQHTSGTIETGPPAYRQLTCLLPAEYRQTHGWTLRRPGFRILALDPPGSPSAAAGAPAP